MTVKLLMDWPDSRDGKNYVAGNRLTTDAGTEAGLIAAKMATSTWTGGTPYIAPAVPIQFRDAKLATDAGGNGAQLKSGSNRVFATPDYLAPAGFCFSG